MKRCLARRRAKNDCKKMELDLFLQNIKIHSPLFSNFLKSLRELNKLKNSNNESLESRFYLKKTSV